MEVNPQVSVNPEWTTMGMVECVYKLYEKIEMAPVQV